MVKGAGKKKANGSVKTSINTATCRRFLTNTGLRASKEGIDEFQKQVNSFALKTAEKAKEMAETANRVTIQDTDIVTLN
jgi:histone H3/H4